ncbi:MAG: LytTR family DNA-binding domain-containing protein [Chitinophagaceae bacterium]
MTSIAIVDDEQHCSDRLLAFLAPYHDTDIVTYDNVAAAVKGINTIQPDILFLDVQLHDQTGFDVLQSVSYQGFSLVFTTAYEQYAVRAFEFSAIDYLLKPVGREDLERAIRKALDKKEKENVLGKINVLLSHLSSGNPNKKISIPTADGYEFVNIADIVRCESDVNYTHVHTSDAGKYVIARTLKQFEEMLSAHGFFRVHNSHLVNLEYVKKYERSGILTLRDGTRLEVSSRRRAELMHCLRL